MLPRRFKWGVCLLLIAILGSNCQATPDSPLVTVEQQTPVPHTTAPSPTPPAPTATPLPTPMPQAQASIMPGSRIAFYSNRDGNPEIYIMDVDSNQVTRLTNDPAFDDSPALSPDGARIAFLTARHDPAPKFPDLKYELYLVNSDGGNLRRLTTTATAEGHPAWSPDGSRISFDADYDGDGYAEIYTLDVASLEVMRLTSNAANDQFADWSPDGTQIAFASDRNGNWDIFVMQSDGNQQHALTDSPDWELFPAWSPDGMQIAFNKLAPRSRNTDIFVMRADGSDVRQLTNAPGFDENPAWSPDGSAIAFQSRFDNNFEIIVMVPDGSAQRPLNPTPDDELWPSWGPALSPGAHLRLEMSAQDLGLRETFQAALGDLDGDGDLDIAFANPMRNSATIWLNDGHGHFEDTGQQLTQYGHGIGLADFDSDGDLDAMIACHQVHLPTRVYLNDGRGMLIDTGQDFGDARTSAADLNLLDLNDDGWLDAHVLYYSEAGVPDKVYLNDGAATFRDSGLVLEEDFIAWGDLDGDGDVDSFGKIWQQGYNVQLNDGAGNFTLHWQMEDPQSTVGDVALADFDSDGDLDALIAKGFHETGSQPARLLWNDGKGQFTDSGYHMNETMGAHFAVGDLDLDGQLDVIVTNSDRPNEVWLNRGTSFLDTGWRLGSGADMSGRPSLGDLDGDGDLDIVIGRFRGGAQIWFNQQL